MQTLDALGCEVIGRKFDEHADLISQERHVALNPGGYFEDPEIFYRGPASRSFQRHLRSEKAVACKIDLRLFCDPTLRDEWMNAAPHIDTLIVSFRDPAEQAHSELRSSEIIRYDPAERDKFIFVSQFLSEYVYCYGAVVGTCLSYGNETKDKLDLLDHAEAADRSSYVERLRLIANLPHDPGRLAHAIENISAANVKTRLNDLDPWERNCAEKIGANAVFEQLLDMRSAA